MHGADRAQVNALLEQAVIDLRRRLIGIFIAGQHLGYLAAFCFAQRPWLAAALPLAAVGTSRPHKVVTGAGGTYAVAAQIQYITGLTLWHACEQWLTDKLHHDVLSCRFSSDSRAFFWSIRQLSLTSSWRRRRAFSFSRCSIGFCSAVFFAAGPGADFISPEIACSANSRRHWASWLEYSFSRRSSCPSSPCLQASACCMIDSLYSGLNTRRVRFSSSGFG